MGRVDVWLQWHRRTERRIRRPIYGAAITKGVSVNIQIPDDLTDEQKAAIVNMIILHGGSIIDIAAVKQTAWDRFITWWYSFWRAVGLYGLYNPTRARLIPLRARKARQYYGCVQGGGHPTAGNRIRVESRRS